MEFGYVPTFSDAFAFTVAVHSKLPDAAAEVPLVCERLAELLHHTATPAYIAARLPANLLLDFLSKSGTVQANPHFRFVQHLVIDHEHARYSNIRLLTFHLQFCELSDDTLNRSVLLQSSCSESSDSETLFVLLDRSHALQRSQLPESQLLRNTLIVNGLAELLSEFHVHDFLNFYLTVFQRRLQNLPTLSHSVIALSPADYGRQLKPTQLPTSSEGEALKARGDVATVFGASEDAVDFYQKASEFFFSQREGLLAVTKTFDKSWIGFIYESMCAFQVDKLQKVTASAPKSPRSPERLAIENKVIVLVSEALKIHGEKNNRWAVCCLLTKFLHFLSGTSQRRLFLESYLHLRRLQDDVGFNPKIGLKVAYWAARIGLKRLAVGLLCTFMLQLDGLPDHTFQKMEYSLECARLLGFSVDGGKGVADDPPEISGVVFSFVLAKVLESKPKSTLRSSQTLHYYLLLLSRNPKLQWLFTNVTARILWDNPFASLEYKILPYVVRMVPAECPKSFKTLEPETKRDDADEDTNSASHIFIYDPRTALRKKSLNWVALKKHPVQILLNNPLTFPVTVDRLAVQTSGPDAVTTSQSFVLPPNALNFPATVQLKPLSAGLLELRGVEVTLNKLSYSNTVDPNCISAIYKSLNAANPHLFTRFESPKTKDLGLIQVAESVPRIGVELINYVPELIHFNENVHLEYRITNQSKRIVRNVILTATVDFENASSKSLRKKIENFELENGEVVFLDLFFHQTPAASARLLSGLPPVPNLGPKRQRFVFVNENLLYRVYKVTVEVETMYSTNRRFQGHAVHEKLFKTFDFFNLTLSRADDDAAVDLSAESYLCLSVQNIENYLQSFDTSIFLVDTIGGRVLAETNLGVRDRLIFQVPSERLCGENGLEKWLEVSFVTKEFGRSGVVVLDPAPLRPVSSLASGTTECQRTARRSRPGHSQRGVGPRQRLPRRTRLRGDHNPRQR